MSDDVLKTSNNGMRDRIAAALMESWDERRGQARACWPDPRSLHCQDCANADADAVIAELRRVANRCGHCWLPVVDFGVQE